MPVTSGMQTSPRIGDRTVLFPNELIPTNKEASVPRTGTSARRQWLVQLRGNLGRRRHVVELPPTIAQVTMGKTEACRCQVDQPGISRLHAALVRRANRGVYLVDLGSRQGTYLNGERVVDQVLLMDGDRIGLGRKVEFEFLDGPRPARSKIIRLARKVLSMASIIVP